jgi:hypothetical protein
MDWDDSYIEELEKKNLDGEMEGATAETRAAEMIAELRKEHEEKLQEVRANNLTAVKKESREGTTS